MGPSYPHAKRISVLSLLTHTAGTADMTSDAFSDYTQLLLADLGRRFTPEDLISLMAALPAHAAPEESYRYSNTDYLLLGCIAERVSGVSFAELLSRRFTTPLPRAFCTDEHECRAVNGDVPLEVCESSATSAGGMLQGALRRTEVMRAL
jgi:hypothetical protein